MKKETAALVLALLLGALGAKAYAGFYHYTDSNGAVHCVDDISNVPEQYRSQLKNAESLSDVSVVGIPGPSRDEALSAKTPRAVDQPAKKTVQYSGTADVFVTSWCGYCKKLEQFLDANGIRYAALDIEKDSNAQKQYKELGGHGVPLTRIGSSVVSGYNPDAILKAIERDR